MEAKEEIVYQHLVKIANSPNQGLNRKLFADFNIEGYDSIVSYMTEKDLIETEYGNDDMYFLTEYGYNCLEQGFFYDSTTGEFEFDVSDEETQKPEQIVAGKKALKKTIIVMLFIGIIVSYYLYFRKDKEPYEAIPEEMIEKIQKGLYRGTSSKS